MSSKKTKSTDKTDKTDKTNKSNEYNKSDESKISKITKISNSDKNINENDDKNEIKKIKLNEKDINNVNIPNNLISSNLHNPFNKTILSTPIMISPDQMDNKMYIHLKSNLINKLENKCYENYGYVDKIYNIEDISDGIIEPEDPSCSAKIQVKFSCKLYLPIIGKELICKIDRMNKALIMGINGPIKVIITADKINKDNFFPDINRNIRVKGTSEIVVPNMYIRVLVISKSFSNYDKNILVIGFLQAMATEKEISEYMNKTDETHIELNNLLED